jgi:prepilin-type N-terminal cleavage/methylation domain-containing protein
MKKMKNDNKGFTLVELIVVLVILAILAAILVPALLGYIDRAREKQYVLNAKSALTATQADLSSLYGKIRDDACITTRESVVKTSDGTPALCAFCGARRTPMRFRADAMRNITDAPKLSFFNQLFSF